MDLRLLVFLAFCGIFSVTHSQQFYIVAPSSLRILWDNQRVAIAVDGDRSVQAHVYVQDHPGKIKNITETILELRPGRPVFNKLVLTPENFPESFWLSRDPLKLVSLTVHSDNFHKEILIPVIIESGYAFVQTDKPIYTPKQRVSIRIIQLNNDGLPSFEEFHLQVRNEKNNIVEETIFNKLPHLEKKAFLTHTFKFPLYPILGKWTVTVLYGFQLKQNSTVNFELREYVLPMFSLNLKTQDVILPSDEIITATVKATYVYGKKVEGSVSLRLGIQSETPEPIIIAIFGPKTLEDGSHTFRINSSELKSFCEEAEIGWFPEIEGSHLVVEANVMDAASGNKEKITDATARFSKTPYTISFKRCLQDFKPGLISVFEADVNYVDGRPAANVPTSISAVADDNPLNIAEPNTVSDVDGKVSFSIHPEIDHTTLTITVRTADPKFGENQAVGKFIQRRYESKSKGYIALQRNREKSLKVSDMYDKTVYIHPPEKISDIYYVIVSKGQIVMMDKMPKGQFRAQHFTFQITQDMVPSFRLIVFGQYDGELLSDSVKVDVENECHSKAKIEVKPESFMKSPGSNTKIIVTGTKTTSVGLLGVDEAVYALSKKDLLTKSKMFKAFAEHDLGCGPGGGLTTDLVLQNVGIIIVTNTYAPPVGSSAAGCKANTRRKRSVLKEKLSQYKGIDRECCALGLSHDPHNRNCQERTDIVVRQLRGNLENCSEIFQHCCLYADKEEVKDMQLPRSMFILRTRAKDIPIDEGNFIPIDDLEMLESAVTLRSDFRETWFSEDMIIGPDQKEELQLSLPHSITTWVVQAVSLNRDYGMCVTEPQNIVSFKPVFLQLNLPYSVVRNEQVEIQAIVYNYGDTTLRGIVYMYGVKGLCTGTQENEKSERKNVKVDPNSAQSITFAVIPMEEGTYDIKVVVVSQEGSDVISKKLYVVAQGYVDEKVITIHPEFL